MSGAKFILSLDCEGKWGVADHLTHFEHGKLTDASLARAYSAIVELLDEFQIPATFAFVGAFTQSRLDFNRMRPALEALRGQAPYLNQALDALGANAEGWHGDDLVNLVCAASQQHEIALHGVTHVPWDSVDREFAAAELDLLGDVQGPIRDSRTFIYPRNRVAHVDVLAEGGFEGYRTAREQRSRFASLLAEINLFERPQGVLRPGNGIVPIPSGYFVNWRHGPRSLVPAAITAKRAALLLEQAARDGGVVHYWLHPENVATAPATLGVLRSIVGIAARTRDAGHCEVVTQADYCRQMRQPN